MPKKIAIIGCSYSEYDRPGARKDHWSYQLYLKYPQHNYINYAHGGRGPVYFQLCLLDAKKRGYDAVFINTTHDGRYSVLADHIDSNNPTFKFNINEISHGYSVASLPDNNKEGDFIELWDCATRPEVRAVGGMTGLQKKFMEIHRSLILSSDINQNMLHSWYETASELYNFEKVWMLDFRRTPPFLKEHQNIRNVWNHLKIKFNVPSYLDLASRGIIMAEDDDHWTPEGHSIVLKDYILNEDVMKYLLT